MEQLVNGLGLLGAYFAVLLVLAVAVESILDVIKRFAPDALQLRARVSPDQLAKDVAEWVPPGSPYAAKTTAITNLMRELKMHDAEITSLSQSVHDATTQLTAVTNAPDHAVLNELARQLTNATYKVREKYDKDEANRVFALRIISAVIGIAIAVFLQIDSMQLLKPLLSADFVKNLADSESLKSIVHVGGMLLTGFGASAGSSFWHDQLDKVRAIKTAARSVEDVGTQVTQPGLIAVR